MEEKCRVVLLSLLPIVLVDIVDAFLSPCHFCLYGCATCFLRRLGADIRFLAITSPRGGGKSTTARRLLAHCRAQYPFVAVFDTLARFFSAWAERQDVTLLTGNLEMIEAVVACDARKGLFVMDGSEDESDQLQVQARHDLWWVRDSVERIHPSHCDQLQFLILVPHAPDHDTVKINLKHMVPHLAKECTDALASLAVGPVEKRFLLCIAVNAAMIDPWRSRDFFPVKL